MSDKKLLEESTIRRFMQLANIKPIGDGLLEEASKKHGKKGEEVHGKKGKEDHGKKGEEGKEGEKKEAPKMEENLEEMYSTSTTTPMEEKYTEETQMEQAEEGGDKDGDVRAALEQIKAGVDALLGMIEGDVGVELDVEEEPEAEGEMGMEEEALMAEAEMVEVEENSEEALAEELTRRVAARLVAEMKKGGGKWGSAPHGKPPKAHGKPKSPKGYKPAKKA